MENGVKVQRTSCYVGIAHCTLAAGRQLKRLILLQKQRSEFSLMQKSHYSSTNSNYMFVILWGTSPMRASPFACSIYSILGTQLVVIRDSMYLLALDITLSLIDCNRSEGYCEQNKQKWWIAKGS
jgi:hypothetical protein